MVENERITGKYMEDLVSRLTNLDKKASFVMKSFQDFVDEIIKIEKLSAGTPVKEHVKQLASDLNNSSVYFANLLSAKLGEIHNEVSGKKSESEEAIPV